MHAHRSTLRPLAAVAALALLLAAAPATADPPVPGQPAPTAGVWPLRPPELVGGFDPPSTRWGAGHRGVDLAGRAGQRVFSALAGTVTFAGPLAGRGVVVVDHGAVRTTYEPVHATVARGDVVEAGAPLGELEAFGSHCAPAACLHWGLIEGERYLDPLTLVGRGPVRLLPLFGDLPPASAGLWAAEAGTPPRALDRRGTDQVVGHGPVRPAGTTPPGVGALFRQLLG